MRRLSMINRRVSSFSARRMFGTGLLPVQPNTQCRRFIPHRPAKYPTCRSAAHHQCKEIANEMAPVSSHRAGSDFADSDIERVVFRVALFSIVLSLTAAPHASLLCTLWCQSSDVPTTCGHHHLSSTTVEGDDRCDATA